MKRRGRSRQSLTTTCKGASLAFQAMKQDKDSVRLGRIPLGLAVAGCEVLRRRHHGTGPPLDAFLNREHLAVVEYQAVSEVGFLAAPFEDNWELGQRCCVRRWWELEEILTTQYMSVITLRRKAHVHG